jgi:IS30 family transposase
MDQITDEERQRIAELVAEGTAPWKLHQEIGRSRYAIRRAVVALHRPSRREPERSTLRLSLAEREEISRGRAAGLPVREIARSLGRAPSTVCREAAANGGRERYDPGPDSSDDDSPTGKPAAAITQGHNP